ncbi:MAG: hypothetical protein AB7S87_16090 [Burkholderiales bacterium]
MRRALSIASVVAAGIIGGCQSGASLPSTGAGGKSASLRVMEQVAIAAHKCWFASKDEAFRPYRFANELDSHSGNPRFLLVPAKNYGGLPLLVVQARGGSSQVEAFGPLMQRPLGARISADVSRWASGNPSCGTAA